MPFFDRFFLFSGLGIKGIQHRWEKEAKLTIGTHVYGIKYIFSLLFKFEYKGHFQVLFEILEKDFNLPSVLIYRGNRTCTEIEVIG